VTNWATWLALAGWILALVRFHVLEHHRFDRDSDRAAKSHAVIGCVVMSLGLLQPLNAFLRPHKEAGGDISPARRIWEVVHKGSGYVALFLAAVNIVLGTGILQAPCPPHRTGASTARACLIVGLTVAYACYDKRSAAQPETSDASSVGVHIGATITGNKA